ncbi:MAG: carboxypeptidase regulatory-like domain-containing protein [Longimicrobiales bacterium]|nr:carboxypeptidase regulatory-like domain-containing protein [Longimicrobiales bacterium]
MRLGRPEGRRDAGRYLVVVATVCALFCGGGRRAVGAQASPTGAPPTARLSGRVVDRQNLSPVSVARILLLHPTSEAQVAAAVSDSAGAFELPPVPFGTYAFHVERIGYKPVADSVTLSAGKDEDLTVQLVPEAVDLEPLVVRVSRTTAYYMRDFEARRATGSGTFITRDQIERRRSNSTSQLLQSLGGVRVAYGTRGEASLFVRGTCRPHVYIDGAAIHPGVSIDMAVLPEDIEGMEIYSTAGVPSQWSSGGTCAAILVWTRPAVRGEGKKVPRWKLITAGGVVFLVWLLRH